MERAPKKRQLLTQQHDERATLLAALDQLHADYLKDLEEIRRQVRKKAFTREITRTRRYHEEKYFWEYLNNLVEDIHLFTWRKTVTASWTANYQRKRYLLKQELRDQHAHHLEKNASPFATIPHPKFDCGSSLPPLWKAKSFGVRFF